MHSNQGHTTPCYRSQSSNVSRLPRILNDGANHNNSGLLPILSKSRLGFKASKSPGRFFVEIHSSMDTHVQLLSATLIRVVPRVIRPKTRHLRTALSKLSTD